jgi:hypothetical protein
METILTMQDVKLTDISGGKKRRREEYLKDNISELETNNNRGIH